MYNKVHPGHFPEILELLKKLFFSKYQLMAVINGFNNNEKKVSHLTTLINYTYEKIHPKTIQLTYTFFESLTHQSFLFE